MEINVIKDNNAHFVQILIVKSILYQFYAKRFDRILC